MFEIGQKIYFKREGLDERLLKGAVIGQDGDKWIIRGARRADRFNPPEYTVSFGEIVTDHIPQRLRVKKTEHHGNSLSIPVAESIRRQAISAQRLGISETQVLQARAMLEIRKRAVRMLAYRNRISTATADFDHQELDAEYVTAQLASLRATAASATDSDIREFKRHLAGEIDYSRVMLTIARTSRTAAVRYLKLRTQYHQLHINIDDLAYRLAA